MSVKTEILKPNEIIRSRAVNLPLESKKLMNAILYIARMTHFKNREMATKIGHYRKFMNLEKNNRYVDLTMQALKNLATPIIIKNYKNDTTGIKYARLSVAFIDNDFCIEKTGNQLFVKIKINGLFFDLMKKAHKGNYTYLSWITSNNLSSKHAMCLYEFLKSMENKGKRVKINLDSLNDLLSIKKLTMSEMVRLITRAVLEIAKKSDLGGLTFKVDKTARVIIFSLYKTKQRALF